jgi:hypothetical protein
MFHGYHSPQEFCMFEFRPVQLPEFTRTIPVSHAIPRLTGSARQPLSIWIGFSVHNEPSKITHQQVETMADSPQDMTRKLPVVPHHEVKETFADQIGFMICDGSTLKIDFEVVRMNEPLQLEPPGKERHVVARLALSMTCAIDLINQVGRLAGQLAQSGLIKTTEQGQVIPQNKPN